MSRDRYERRHRRTAKNAQCVEVMANADFGAVPNLSEAMGLETSVRTSLKGDRTMNERLTIDGQSFRLTTDHAASSHGRPVLVSEDGVALGPDDTCRFRLEAGSDEAVRALASAGFTFDDCRE